MSEHSKPERIPGPGIRIPNPDLRLRDETARFRRDEPDALSAYTDEVDQGRLRELARAILHRRKS